MSPLLSYHDYLYCYFSSHVYVFISRKECFTVDFLVFFFLQCTPSSLFHEPQNRSSVWVHPLGLHYSWPLLSTLCIVEDFCHGLHVLSGGASLMRGSGYNSLVFCVYSISYMQLWRLEARIFRWNWALGTCVSWWLTSLNMISISPLAIQIWVGIEIP